MFLKWLLGFVILFSAGMMLFAFYTLAGIAVTWPIFWLCVSIVVVSMLVSWRVKRNLNVLLPRLDSAITESERLDITGLIYEAKFPQRVFTVSIIVAGIFAFPYLIRGDYEQIVVLGFPLDCLTLVIMFGILFVVIHYLKKWLRKKK